MAKADNSEVEKKGNDEAIMSKETDDDEPLVVNDNISENDDEYDSDNSGLDLEDSEYEYDEPDSDEEVMALQAKFDAEEIPPGAEVSVPWLVVEETKPSSSVPEQLEEIDEAVMNYRSFRSFDAVIDFSDHHYKEEKVTDATQASRKWTKAIQQDWRLLKKNLPETIFVRAYEERMDLLRAVIVGAAGTPYHDGLFFFDVYFPPQYPDTPPKVNYHAHGLGINPNLYHNGYVCLSLLNTWQGTPTESWTPGESTMLQVLLSIQALVLNEKPYYNEPGFETEAGTVLGEKTAQIYNECTFLLSCKTMMYTLKNPPKYFEDYVVGHFRLRAHTILAACKAYIEGAQIGCVVEEEEDVDEGKKSGVVEEEQDGDKGKKSAVVEEEQDANEGKESDVDEEEEDANEGKKSSTSLPVKKISTSLKFRKEVGTMAGNLVPVFLKNGAKNIEHFICLGDSFRLDETNYTDIFKKDFYKPVQDEDADEDDADLKSQAQPQPFDDFDVQFQSYGHMQAFTQSFGHGQTSSAPSFGHGQIHAFFPQLLQAALGLAQVPAPAEGEADFGSESD